MNIFKSLDYHVESGTTIAVGFKSSCSDLQNNAKPAENGLISRYGASAEKKKGKRKGGKEEGKEEGRKGGKKPKLA